MCPAASRTQCKPVAAKHFTGRQSQQAAISRIATSRNDKNVQVGFVLLMMVVWSTFGEHTGFDESTGSRRRVRVSV